MRRGWARGREGAAPGSLQTFAQFSAHPPIHPPASPHPTTHCSWYRAGIFNALSPWSGAYGSYLADGTWTVGPMVWASAHTTQFTQPGWLYSPVGGAGGAGHLAAGGSYVSLVSPDGADFTLVVEKMSRNHSSCVRPGLPNYVTEPETAVFTLTGGLAAKFAGKTLQLWFTHWAWAPGDTTQEFERQADVAVGADGSFSVTMPVDSIATVSTVTTAVKGSFAAPPPPPTLFPAAHTDDFEACAPSSEGGLFTDQNGIFECEQSGDPAHGMVMRQMVPLRPVTWGGDIRPHSLIGHRDSRNQSLVVDARVDVAGSSVLLGVHMQGTDNSAGIIFSADTTGSWWLHPNINAVGSAGSAFAKGSLPAPLTNASWHTWRVDVNGTAASQVLNVWMDGAPVVTNLAVAGQTTSGHGAIGTRQYGDYTLYDNFQLYTTYVQCGGTPVAAGAPVSAVHCNSEVGMQPGSRWDFNPAVPGGMVGTFSIRGNPKLCLAASPAGSGAPEYLVLAACAPGDAQQTWSWTFDGVAPDGERKSSIELAGQKRCIDLFGQVGDIGDAVDAWPCSGGSNQAFWYDHDAGEIGTESYSLCIGVC